MAVQFHSVPICSSQITFLSFFLVFGGTEKKKKKEERDRDRDRNEREYENPGS